MTRRMAVLSVAALLFTPTIVAAQIPTSVCPKSSKAYVIEPFGSSFGRVGQPVTDLQNQGFSVTTIRDASATISAIDDALGDDPGVLIFFGHGNSSGISGEALPYSADNIRALSFRVTQYQAMGVTNLAVTWDPAKTFCCIEMQAAFISSNTAGKRALFINASCLGSTYQSSWKGARVVLSYSTSPYNTDMLNDMNALFQKLRGGSGDAYRYVTAASQGMNYTSYGNGELVLSPVVLSITPIEGSSLGGDGNGTIVFNAKMDRSDAKRIVLGTGSLVIVDQNWDDDHTISYGIEPTCQGTGRVNVIAAQAKADGGGNRYLDGDGDGTYNDDYWAEYTVSNDVHCDNQAVSLSAFWATQDVDATRVEWVADVERNAQSYTVLGQPGDVPLVPVPVKSGVGPHAYSAVVPSGYSSYGISETETCGKVNVYRGAVLAPAPAERAAALAIDVSSLPTGPHPIAPEPQAHTPFDGGGEGGGGGSPVAQIVIVGPDSLQQELGPALDAWRSDGLHVEQFSTTSPDPEPIQAYLTNKKHDADALHEAYPWVMILGDANEGGEPAENIVSTFYAPDTTGGVFFGSDYATDDPYTDFNQDGIADFPTFRLPADQRVEVRNAVQTYLAVRQAHNSTRSLLLLTGDVDEAGNPSANVVLGAQAVHDRYAVAGFQVDQLLDSSFPYNDHLARQQAFAARLTAGVTEIWGRAPLTNRSIWPGYFAQKAYSPNWNWNWVSGNSHPIFWAPGCDVADYDRNNPVFDPTLAEQFLFAASGKPSFVAVASCTRGGYGLAHDCFEDLLREARFTPGLRTSLDVFWYAKREFAKRFPGFIGYVQAMTYLGWPAPLPEYTQTGVAEIPTLPPALLTAAPNPFSSSTVVHFALEHDAHVRVDVVDVQGRLIQTLVDEVRQAGDVAVHWDGSHMANGIYYVRAKTPTRTTTVSLTHIR